MDSLTKQMIYFLGRTEWDGTRFHHAAQIGVQLKTGIVYFWNFPSNIFRLKTQKANPQVIGDFCSEFQCLCKILLRVLTQVV